MESSNGTRLAPNAFPHVFPTMNRTANPWVCATILWTLAAPSLFGSYSNTSPPFEKTSPTYQLPANPHPSLAELIAGLKKRSLREPKNADVWYQLGLSYALANRTQDAVSALQTSVKLDSFHIRAWENLGINLHEENRDDEALAAFQKATQVGASDADVWNDLGNILMIKNRLPESENALNEGLNLSPTYKRLWNSLGLLKGKQGDLKGATDAYAKAVQIDPKYAIGWNNLGVAQMKMKNDEAFGSFQKAIQLDPKFEPAWANLADFYGGHRQWKESQSAARQATLLNPDDARAFLSLALSSSMLQNWEEAVAAYSTAFDRLNAREKLPMTDSLYAMGLAEYGRACACFHHYEDADKLLGQALALEPNNAQVFKNIGVARIAQSRNAEALEAFQKAVALQPKDAQTWLYLGSLYESGLNKPAEALDAYRQAAALEPSNAEAWYEGGMAEEALKNDAKAAQDVRKALELDPAKIAAWRALAVFTSDREESDRAIGQAISLDPKNGTSYRVKGGVQMDRKNWPEAEKAFRQAADLEKGNSVDWYFLGRVLSAQKRFAEAIPAFKTAIQNGSSGPIPLLASYWGFLGEAHMNLVHGKELTEWKSALDAFNHATALDPAHSAYWYEAALCDQALGVRPEADAAMLKWKQAGGLPSNAPNPLGSAPNPESIPQDGPFAVANSIKSLIRGNQFDEALKLARHEADAHPERAVAWYSLGDVLMAEKRYDEAVPLLVKATNLDPKFGPPWFDLGVSQASLQKFDQAIDSFCKSIDLMPNFPDSWINLMKCYFAEHALSEGEDKIGDLAKAHPLSPYGWEALGEIQYDSKMFATAVTSLQKAIDLKPDYVHGLDQLGLAHAYLNETDKALDCFLRASQLPPDASAQFVLNHLGYIYFLMGNTDKAIEVYKQALAAGPRNKDILCNIIAAYAKEKQWDQARAACATLEEVDPSDSARLSRTFPSAASDATSASLPPSPSSPH